MNAPPATAFDLRKNLLLAVAIAAMTYLFLIPFGTIDEEDRFRWDDVLMAGIILLFPSDLPQQLGSLTWGREGFVAKFDRLSERVEDLSKLLAELEFLLSSILTDYEYEKLRGLALEEPFLVHYRQELDEEVKRLRALGYIEANEGTGLAAMRRERAGASTSYDLKAYFRVTGRGKVYIAKRL